MISTASHPLRPDSPPLDTPSPAPYSSTPTIPPPNGELVATETGYFDGFDRESTQHDDEPDDGDRPPLKSHSTIRAIPANLSSPRPVPTESPTIPRHLAFPRPPHLLPATTLAEIPTPHLIALVVALSNELTDSKENGDRTSRVNKALEELLRDKGMSEGELERARLRAGVAVELLAVPPADWQIELSVEDGAGDAGREEQEINRRRSRKSIVARDQTEAILDLDDLAEAISENAFAFASPRDIGEPTPIFSDSDSVSKLSILSTSPDQANGTATVAPPSTTVSPLSNCHVNPPARHRHSSLSSRLFGSFSLASATSPEPPIVSPIPTRSLTSSPGHARSSSVASSTSAVSIPASSKSSGSKGPSESRSQESWTGWKSWTRGSKKADVESIASGSVSIVTGVPEEEDGDSSIVKHSTDEEQDWNVTVGKSKLDKNATPTPSSFFAATTGRRRGESNATSKSIASATSILSSSIYHSPPASPSPSTTDRKSSLVTSTLSSPPSSFSPASNRQRETRDRSASSSPSRSRASSTFAKTPQSTMPLTIPRLTTIEPTLSTPMPTSVLSSIQDTTNLSTPSHTTRGIMDRSTSYSSTASTSSRKSPTHFEAIAMSAGWWISGSSTIFVRPSQVGEKIRGLVDGLMGNVATGDMNAVRTSQRSTKEEIARPSSPVEIPAVPTIATNQIAFLNLPTPIYSSDSSLSPTTARAPKGYVSSAKGTIGRALGLGASASSSLAASISRSPSDSLRRAIEPNLTLFPKLSTLSKYSPFAQPALSTPVTQALISPSINVSRTLPQVGVPSNAANPASSTTMELSTISGEAAPPTLSSGMTRSGSMNDPDDADQPLVDRYGFVYDVRSGMKLLREARRRKERAGLGEEEEDGAEVVLQPATTEDILTKEDVALQLTGNVEQELEALREAMGLPPSIGGSPTVSTSRTSSRFDGPPISPSPSSLSLDANSSTLRKSTNKSPSTRQTRSPSDLVPTSAGQQSMKRLLGQLTSMHDAVDKTQKTAWDSFIHRRQLKLARQSSASATASADGTLPRRRRNGTTKGLLGETESLSEGDDAGWSENLVGVAQMGLAGKEGKEDWNEFKALVRKGIPIAYRPKIWSECSGATDAKEPGLYQELLSQHAGQENLCLTQIDMDCHRTFPTNSFFAGNGPGVAKLRNVLIAYSWRNPTIGYCQGMNNLTATLLLTHPAEEDAFWVLCCIIEKILPADYYTSHLLVSQADQRVLRDLIQRHLPNVAGHLQDLEVELPAVTFGWFLSLFTDAVPIQTLLRIWDLLFVFGSVVLFRVAVAIIQMNSTEILACDSAANLYASMRLMTTHLYQVDKLLKLAFEGPVVKDREIATLRSKHVLDLQKEMSLFAESEAVPSNKS